MRIWVVELKKSHQWWPMTICHDADDAKRIQALRKRHLGGEWRSVAYERIEPTRQAPGRRGRTQ